MAIDSTLLLAEASAAHERAARGHIQGKIVLTVTEPVTHQPAAMRMAASF